MARFRIRFCNDLLNAYGQAFHVCQRELVVAAKDDAGALKAAKREFEKLERVPSWRLRARSIACESLLEPV
jgi:hypothetical protein